MFTSRSEFRLTLRAENADLRLTPMGIDLGIISEKQQEVYHRKRELMAKATDFMMSYSLANKQWSEAGIKSASPTQTEKVSAFDITAYP